MKITVVIPCFNVAGVLSACLQGLSGQEVLPEEIVCVDNGSTDNTRKVIEGWSAGEKKLSVVLVHAREKGPAAARNAGVKAAGGEVIAFIDADCVPRKDWIRNIRRSFASDLAPDVVGGIEGPAGAVPKTLVGRFLSAFWITPAYELPRGMIGNKEDWLRSKFIATFNCAIRKEWLVRLGGLDESLFPAGEDVDLWMRAVDAGARVLAWEEGMVVQHVQDVGVIPMLRKYWDYKDGAARLVKKHFGRKWLVVVPGPGLIAGRTPWGSVLITSGTFKVAGGVFILVLLSRLEPVSAVVALAGGFVYYYMKLKKRSALRNGRVSRAENFFYVVLLVMREAVEFIAGIWSSVKHRVISL